MLFILVEDKLLKSMILSVILYGCLTEIENKEHFGNEPTFTFIIK